MPVFNNVDLILGIKSKFMLTRLKINGFKNLINVDVRFGPFTCVAGANGVGKSNLFDAIRFLSALADMSFLEAAKLVRDSEGHMFDIRGLFHHVGDIYDEKMEFEVEMIVPKEGVDNLGQKARATTTFLKYRLCLKYSMNDGHDSIGKFELIHESLDYIRKHSSPSHLLFKHSASKWRNSLGLGKRSSPFISTDNINSMILLHQDGGSRGKPRKLLAKSLPRTVLSDTNASESPTALLARLEMRSWRLLQLEPTALRRPDEFTAPSQLTMNGAHLAKSLYERACRDSGYVLGDKTNKVYSEITARLSRLLEEVKDVKVDKDEKRQLFTLLVAGKDGTYYPARSLSDGTLRFLALAVIELERIPGLICFEEPENGIHPKRVEAMLRLLQDIAVDPLEELDNFNPLRQVIINTHSPLVVSLVSPDSLLIAELVEGIERNTNTRYKYVQFKGLPGTWRGKDGNSGSVAMGELLAYLNPMLVTSRDNDDSSIKENVKEFFDKQMELIFDEG